MLLKSTPSSLNGMRYTSSICNRTKQQRRSGRRKNILEWGEKSLRDKDGEISFGGWHDKLRVASLPYMSWNNIAFIFMWIWGVDARIWACFTISCYFLWEKQSWREDYYSSIELLPLPFLCIYPVWYCQNDFVKIITICSSTLDHDAHIVTESRCMKAWWEL